MQNGYKDNDYKEKLNDYKKRQKITIKQAK